MPVPVTAVANGLIAWEMLDDAKLHFDLVLTDVVMPCLSGVGLLSKMMKREASKRVPIVSKLHPYEVVHFHPLMVRRRDICVWTQSFLERQVTEQCVWTQSCLHMTA